MNYDQNDQDSLALCVWKEARGERQLGMEAVAHVIVNRALAWYSHLAESVHAAVYAKNQFTSMSVPSDPEFNLQPKPDDPQFAYCEDLSRSLLSNVGNPDFTDPTSGALYYCNPVEATSGWFATHIVADTIHHPQVAEIGHQLFYK